MVLRNKSSIKVYYVVNMSEIIYGNESLLWRWRLVYDGQTEKNINVNGVRELEIKKERQEKPIAGRHYSLISTQSSSVCKLILTWFFSQDHLNPFSFVFFGQRKKVSRGKKQAAKEKNCRWVQDINTQGKGGADLLCCISFLYLTNCVLHTQYIQTDKKSALNTHQCPYTIAFSLLSQKAR